MPFATIDGTRLHYLDRGSGAPAVVLLHAFPLHAGMWEPQLAALAGRCRMIAPDLIGFGVSDAPEDRSAYSMETYADQVAGLVRHLGLERVVVVGLSMGGYVAFSLLRRHRDLVSALALADTRAGADAPEVVERRTRQQDQVAERGTAELIETLLEGLLAEDTRRHRPDVVQQVRMLMQNPPAGYVGALEAMKRRPDATGELAGIDVPTLLLVGEHDSLSPPSLVGEMHTKVEGSRLAVIPAAAHLSNVEAPEEFNRALAELLDDLAGG